MLSSKVSHSDQDDDGESKYLLFSVGDNLFGTPLLGVREVVEPQSIKPIPNTVKDFLGVINIRGEIVGVTDLRIRFNLPAKNGQTMAMIIFESAVGPLAVLVDKVESVSTIIREEIDNATNINSAFPLEYIIGIGKVGGKLATLIHLSKVLEIQELGEFRKTKKIMKEGKEPTST